MLEFRNIRVHILLYGIFLLYLIFILLDLIKFDCSCNKLCIEFVPHKEGAIVTQNLV